MRSNKVILHISLDWEDKLITEYSVFVSHEICKDVFNQSLVTNTAVADFGTVESPKGVLVLKLQYSASMSDPFCQPGF